ncbi:hypothetical protein A3I36_02165 [Candidatus Giovannonibacteria bacterium RIFCSPLOWO2_02_FULL_45_28]|uniref:Uncharacterized protein n=3 Tax=Parcubacteria group TaxID=1794811 RepID=A0A837IGC0_9BACT|nr:MAG: hypothetical protein UW53_C0029G0001 [Candidatus Giovannonibacteria bacterium GW2011_GWA1_44_25]KKU12101.1 MAG: hypothetical protein UX18_C0030G0001 [Candidatus Azambacteria bacterium GW2011_GWC2_45_7b]KKU28916.1 MAG: hypothetical protein UX43_C0018G0001 [Candidatus Giovannonibacteria bacterium GW2011_GWB1_46_20]OGF50024.1 MAG: hypothetical protein A2120_02770 [Candidatus Giovannonibacteria bacterium GWA2_45_15]OGF59345.1 MAG: hypothetical protein A2W40_04155 [Candidatus Giovannonibacte
MNLRVKKILLWAAAVVFAVYAVIVIIRIPHAIEQKKTAEVVAKIHASKLTLDDVVGKNFPPDPGADADKTIEGVDANNNGIRDDVELAIFKKYPNSAKTRAAYLQYAMALQIGLTQIFNSETLVAMAQERTRAGNCLYELGGGIRVAIEREDSFKKLILNTDARKNKLEEVYERYMVSHGDLKGKLDCDIDPATLPN